MGSEGFTVQERTRETPDVRSLDHPEDGEVTLREAPSTTSIMPVVVFHRIRIEARGTPADGSPVCLGSFPIGDPDVRREVRLISMELDGLRPIRHLPKLVWFDASVPGASVHGRRTSSIAHPMSIGTSVLV